MGLCIVQVKLMLQGLLFVITGELLNLLAIPLGYCSVLKAEAAGLEFGLATALRFGFKNIPVEGDSQVLIRLLRLHKDWSFSEFRRCFGIFVRRLLKFMFSVIFTSRA
ncbi:hypothetical protein L3X38_000108 [Prunus dulcis]|uniref:RNase H type-1 domain-containing protein n=1 Tax=Prunus dulcis TaxID=3755 RepID=A0AAD4YJP5_PRUDU|nr:hypothetical protein L3X38_000108 [Prunus dulcis]